MAAIMIPIWGFIPLAFFDLLGLAALGAPIMAVCCEMVGKSSRKVFFDKLGMQLAGAGVAALFLSLAGIGAVVAIGLPSHPEFKRLFAVHHRELAVLAVFAGAFALSLALYRFTWKALKRSKGLHIALGWLAALAGLGFIVAVCLAMRSSSAVFLSGAEATLGFAEAFQAQGTSLMWPAMAVCLGWAVCYGGATGLVYLVYRRNKDDFGRDYYAFGLPVAAGWTLAGLGLLLAALAWFVTVLPVDLFSALMVPGATAYWGGLIGCLLAAGLFWGLVARSGSPLKLKGVIVLGFCLAWAAHSLAAIVLFRMYVDS